MDDKRARKRANEATLSTISTHKPNGAIIESKSGPPQSASGRDSQRAANRTPLVDLLGNVDGSDNVSQIAAEVWYILIHTLAIF